MKNNYFLKMKIAAAFVFCMGLQNGAKAQTINVSEDSYVYAGANSTVNYGSGVEAAARDTVNATVGRITYYKFPLSTLTGKQVTTAKIKFFTYLPSTAAATEILQLHKMPTMFGGLANTWTEAAVTWDTRPNVNPTSFDEVTISSVAIVPAGTPNNYANSYDVNVADYLNEALAAGQTDITIAIKAKPKNAGGKDKQVRLGTKEAGTGGQYGASITYSGVTALGITDFKTNQAALKVYPNPISESFSLSTSFDKSDVVEVSVLNVLGAKVASFKETVGSGTWTKELNAKELNMNKGVYLIKISSKSNGTSTNKIIVQ